MYVDDKLKLSYQKSFQSLKDARTREPDRRARKPPMSNATTTYGSRRFPQEMDTVAYLRIGKCNKSKIDHVL